MICYGARAPTSSVNFVDSFSSRRSRGNGGRVMTRPYGKSCHPERSRGISRNDAHNSEPYRGRS